jgi:hypothetical protein
MRQRPDAQGAIHPPVHQQGVRHRGCSTDQLEGGRTRAPQRHSLIRDVRKTLERSMSFAQRREKVEASPINSLRDLGPNAQF